MEDRLQHQPTALEPQRAHTNRVRSTPQAGAKLEQTLLMNEGNLGSRSVGIMSCLTDRNLNSTIHAFFRKHEIDRTSEFVRNEIAYEIGPVAGLDLRRHWGAA